MDIKATPNSHRYKAEQAKASEKKVQKIVSGNVKTRKKSEMSKFKDTIFAEDVNSVKSYLFIDVIIPAIKKAIFETVTNGVDMMLYGEVRGKKRSSYDQVSYRDYSKSDRPYSSRSSTSFDLDEISFDNRGDAEAVLDGMTDILNEYDSVSVGDLYDMIGKTAPFTAYRWGWTSIRRATNSAGNSGWSMHASVVLGKEPSAPTTWSSTTTAMVGESLNLYWVHNSQDGSYEKMAELELTVNGSTETKTFYNNTSEDDQDKARSYSVNTGQYTEGTTIKWRVRTSGITGAYSEWSVLREVNVYARPTVALIVTNQNGAVISSLSSFPFYLKASPGPASQKPISYHVEITADDGYETVDQVGNVIRISAGESIYSKYFNSSSILIVEFSAGNVDFENGMTYTATVTVSMNSGLSCSASKTFTVDWEETISEPNAEIGYDSERYTCQIRPYCEDMDGNLINGILLSVYRREYNGEFIEIASGLPNSASHYVIDPHPALDYARYRIIATETATGAVSYYDVPGYPINESGVIIQWSEAWSAFDVSDANEADVVDTPPWSGSLIRIPYNIDVSDKADPDVTLVKYAGRKRQVSYYGTQLGESSTWRVEIPADDNETLYALRRLMIWTGDVYVREPSGSGYWANVKVSFSRTHCALTIPVTFDITRVEGGM